MAAEPVGPRRFLIATATAHYKNEPDWDRPGLVEARQEVIDLFTQRFGYQHVSDLGLNPTEHQLTEQLRLFCKSPERREDDLIAVYVAGHGEVLDEDEGGGHVLLTHDSEPDDIADALPTETLARKMLTGTRVRRLLLMLDTCYSGQGGNELTASALERMSRRWGATPGSGLAIVSSAQPLEQARTGAFPRLLREAAEDLAVAGHAPATLALEAVVQRMNAAPGCQRIGLTQVGLTGAVPPFLPNPRREARPSDEPQPTAVDLAVRQEAAWQRQADLRDVELSTRLLVRATGHHGTGSGWWFAGRRTALADLADWLADSPRSAFSRPALAVTAGPGSGKTAVLGVIAALAHPVLRHAVPVHSLGLGQPTVESARLVDLAVYARTLTDQQVLDALAAAVRVRAATVGELLAALDGRSRPLTVLIDGLDEADSPDTLCTGVLRPLIAHADGRIRLLLGTRPHLLPRLGLPRDQQIDLDAGRYADPEAVLTYTVRNLLQAHAGSPYRSCEPVLTRQVAVAVAATAGRSFLVARLAAGTLAAVPELPDLHDPAWHRSLPRHADEAMAKDLTVRLGPDAARAADLLRPLAYAQGQGLPWEDLWAALAGGISGRHYTDADISWLREKAGAYVVEAVADGRSAYRLYHQALAEHLRAEHLRSGADDTAVHAAFARTLTDHVPYGADGTPDWSRAHPYVLRYLAGHATLGGVLDAAVTDTGYLVHADPDGLVPHLHAAQAEPARLAAAVYRSSIGTHRTTTPGRRRRILALDAARYNHPSLLNTLNRPAPPGGWVPRHATGSTVSAALCNTMSGHTDAVTAVACTVVDGRPVAVTGSVDGTVRVWDLATGQPVGQPLSGHGGGVRAVVCAELGGRPVAVSGSYDGTVRVWDLATGQPVGQPLSGHGGGVRAVVCAELGGRPVAVSGSYDGTVRVWDLATGQPVGQPLSGHGSGVRAVACTELAGRPVVVAVTGSYDAVCMWDLTTAEPLGQPLRQTRGMVDVACTVLDGRPVAVTSSGGRTVRVWDLVAGRPIGQPLTGHTDIVAAVACTVLDGRPVAVTGSEDCTVRVWDLTASQPVGQALNGHTDTVTAVACTVLDGRPVAVTGSKDCTVRVWDLGVDRPLGQPLSGHTDTVTAAACTVLDGRPVAVTGSWDRTVRVWDLAAGRPIGQPLTGHTDMVTAAACTSLDGRPVAVTGSIDSSLRVWDLAAGRAIGLPLTGHANAVAAVACTVLEGRPVAVTGSWDATVRVWDLTAGRAIGLPLTGHTNAVAALACTVLEGRRVAVTGSWDATVRVWDLAAGKPVGRPLTGHTGKVIAVACVVLDGRPVAVTGSEDHTVRLWDLAAGKPIGRPLTGHTGKVTAVACAVLDGRPVAVTGSDDHTVRFWDLLGLAPVDVLDLPAQCSALALSDVEWLACAFGRDIAVFGRHA
ncbi:hypothetical protein [Kitasatospora sp. GAS1066B]|uniref:hypothetical protein n=1 Tax=Kitasatospora sp. GAS1066B TaxID=3156271 RepID=UPI0035112E65